MPSHSADESAAAGRALIRGPTLARRGEGDPGSRVTVPPCSRSGPAFRFPVSDPSDTSTSRRDFQPLCAPPVTGSGPAARIRWIGYRVARGAGHGPMIRPARHVHYGVLKVQVGLATGDPRRDLLRLSRPGIRRIGYRDRAERPDLARHSPDSRFSRYARTASGASSGTTAEPAPLSDTRKTAGLSSSPARADRTAFARESTPRP